jgi:alpha-tubulin suppressor-like RCC1 family protein
MNSFDLRYRGKGDYYRLGHGNDSHVRRPQVVEVFRGKKIVDVAVGALHCLAVTEQGQVQVLELHKVKLNDWRNAFRAN